MAGDCSDAHYKCIFPGRFWKAVLPVRRPRFPPPGPRLPLLIRCPAPGSAAVLRSTPMIPMGMMMWLVIIALLQSMIRRRRSPGPNGAGGLPGNIILVQVPGNRVRFPYEGLGCAFGSWGAQTEVWPGMPRSRGWDAGPSGRVWARLGGLARGSLCPQPLRG